MAKKKGSQPPKAPANEFRTMMEGELLRNATSLQHNLTVGASSPAVAEDVLAVLITAICARGPLFLSLIGQVVSDRISLEFGCCKRCGKKLQGGSDTGVCEKCFGRGDLLAWLMGKVKETSVKLENEMQKKPGGGKRMATKKRKR